MGHALPEEAQTLQFTEDELRKLESVRRSRTEEERRARRAAFLLDSLSGQGNQTIAQHHHVTRSTVVLCVQKCLEFGSDRLGAELCGPEAQGLRYS